MRYPNGLDWERRLIIFKCSCTIVLWCSEVILRQHLPRFVNRATKGIMMSSKYCLVWTVSVRRRFAITMHLFILTKMLVINFASGAANPFIPPSPHPPISFYPIPFDVDKSQGVLSGLIILFPHSVLFLKLPLSDSRK